ncbi:hypothetical protein KAZ92_03350, partial [Candidatus Gracilibacteria bacterium]|nr:hypothetical protein [Candidatus Gracilibacteria bacterium]
SACCQKAKSWCRISAGAKLKSRKMNLCLKTLKTNLLFILCTRIIVKLRRKTRLVSQNTDFPSPLPSGTKTSMAYSSILKNQATTANNYYATSSKKYNENDQLKF